MLSIFFFWPHQAACEILVPWPGIEPAPPALEAQSLNHWTAREVPERLFICLLAICKSSLGKCLFKSFARFLTVLFFCWCCCWVVVLHIFWILIPHQIVICKYFLPFCRLLFTLLIVSSDAQKFYIKKIFFNVIFIHFLKVTFLLEYYKIVAIFPVLYNTSLSLFYTL